MTSARRTVLGAIGVTGIAVAVGIVVGLAPSSLVGAASGLDATLVTGVLGAALLAYALRRRRASGATKAGRLGTAPERAEPAAPGQTVDDALEWITDSGPEAGTRGARSEVRAAVRDTAIRAYASETGVSMERAADAVDSGEWTDDRVAAAFVGDERAPHFPLRERLRGWVRPERAFSRRADRAAGAAHALATSSASPTGHSTRLSRFSEVGQ